MVKNIYQLSFEHNGHGGLRDQIVKAVEKTQASIVRFQAHIPEKCRSTSVLGSYRQGTGIVINPQGHMLTVGYLIMEATEVQVALADDTVIQAEVAGVDFDSGLGLLRPTEPVDAVPITIGQSLRTRDQPGSQNLDGDLPCPLRRRGRGGRSGAGQSGAQSRAAERRYSHPPESCPRYE